MSAPDVGDPKLAPLVARTEGLQPWRRVFHAANGLVIAGALALLEPSRELAAGLLALLAAGLFALDLVRLGHSGANRLFFTLLRPFASPREAAGIASSTWYIVGCLFAVALFPPEIAIASILVLAIADPLASYIGRRWGRIPFGTGTVEGTAVFALTAFALLALQVPPGPAAGAALSTALLERAPWPLDDNLVIPVTAGTALVLLL